MLQKSMIAHRVVEPPMGRTGHTTQCENRSLCHITPDRTRPHWPFTFLKRSAHLNISNEAKPWHRAAPWLLSAVTILGLIVIFHR
jgi:hypothetical protein